MAEQRPVLFSRRGGRGRYRRRAQQGIPDWAWGVILGVFAVAVLGGILLLSRGGLGGGGGTCDNPLPPLETSDISAEGFRQEDIGLTRVIDLANQGSIGDAEAAFFGPVHNFTHNVDPPLREVDEGLAKDLCNAVLQIEENLVSNPSPLQISSDAQRLRDLLRQAARALGFPLP